MKKERKSVEKFNKQENLRSLGNHKFLRHPLRTIDEETETCTRHEGSEFQAAQIGQSTSS